MFFEDRVSCTAGWPRTGYGAEVELEVPILLPLPPQGTTTPGLGWRLVEVVGAERWLSS